MIVLMTELSWLSSLHLNSCKTLRFQGSHIVPGAEYGILYSIAMVTTNWLCSYVRISATKNMEVSVFLYLLYENYHIT